MYWRGLWYSRGLEVGEEHWEEEKDRQQPTRVEDGVLGVREREVKTAYLPPSLR